MTAAESDSEAVSCTAGILVGGRSRRMGRAKALLPLPGGTTLIEHVAGVASQVAQDVVILGQLTALPAPLTHLPVLPDAEPDRGPLAGLCSLLEYARARWGLLLACDMPCLAPAVIHRILAAARSDVDAVAFLRDNPAEPYHACCALYHPRILPEALSELAEGRASLQGLLARVRVAALRPDPQQTPLLMNVNTPQDHARALRHLRGG